MQIVVLVGVAFVELYYGTFVFNPDDGHLYTLV